MKVSLALFIFALTFSTATFASDGEAGSETKKAS